MSIPLLGAGLSAVGGATFDTTSLIGWWDLADATDEHTNSLDLTENNSPTYTTGKFGNAVDLEKDSSQYRS